MIVPSVILAALLAQLLAVCALAAPGTPAAPGKPGDAGKPPKPDRPKVEIDRKTLRGPKKEGEGPSREFPVMFDIASRARNRRDRAGNGAGKK